MKWKCQSQTAYSNLPRKNGSDAPDADPLLPDGLNGRSDRLEDKLGPVLERATVGVRALVRVDLQELVGQVA